MAKKANPVNWFEIPVAKIDRAKAFYQGVFGVKLGVEKMGPATMAFFPMADKAYGAAGALTKAKGYKPSKSGTLVYFSVSDINATLKKVKAKHGKTLMPKTSIGEWGFVAQFQDCEGNRVALHSMK